MQILKTALDARVPFIAIKTEDPLYAENVLAFVADTDVVMFNPNGDDLKDIESLALPEEEVLFTVCPIESKELYFKLAAAKKSLVFVNPPKPSIFHFNGGTLLPPKEMTYQVVFDVFKDEEKTNSVVQAFGGLTLKDVRELIQMAKKEFGEVTAKGINEVRQNYVTKLKGMVQVDTTLEYYDCPKKLEQWLGSNVYFFENEVDPTLVPRGLLFDGTPGTGKTAASKAIANALGMPLFRLDIGGMKGKYVGDSEGNLNAALQQIDALAPCVVIFDEIEKMFGETHDSGVTSSMLGTLLWWLQEHQSKVFTVMTTNDVKKIPVELWRPGRIDEKMEFKGLESEASALKFADQMATNLLQKVKVKDADSITEALKTGLKTIQYPVPQVKVLNMVNSAVKAAFLKEVEEK